jgi:exopolysaccharide biosynthesis polyprenyl glycosylphosphotransferase
MVTAATTGISERLHTIRRRDALYRRGLGVADAAAVALSLYLGIALIAGHSLRPAALATLPLIVVMAKVLGLYDRDEYLLHKTTLDEVPSLFTLATVNTFLVFLADGAVTDGPTGRGALLATWALLFVFLALGRSLAREIVGLMTPPERCMFVGDTANARQLAQKLSESHSIRADLVAELTIDSAPSGEGLLELLPTIEPMLAADGIDRVIIAPGAGTEGGVHLMHVIRQLKTHGAKVSLMPILSRVVGLPTEIDRMDGIALLGMRRFEVSRSSQIVKRSFDLVGSSLALIVLSPLIAGIAGAIKLDSRGPVFFRQRRVGREGRQFEMLKFRSMEAEAETRKEELRHLNEGAEGLFKIVDDPRLTRVGRFIRRWSLDELPQLFHVLSGKMSLVGPRPLVPEEDRLIEGWYRDRLDVRPGMTGYWQSLGSARISLQEMVKLDYLYLANWSLWNDIRILIRTLGFVIGRRGI